MKATIHKSTLPVCILMYIVTTFFNLAHSTTIPGVKVVGEYLAPGLSTELSGIYPHPTQETLYFVVANKYPNYSKDQKPMLEKKYRGKLLTVERDTAKIVDVSDLSDGDYGGIAFAKEHLYISSLNPSEILKFSLVTKKVVARFPLSAPAGGLEYDESRNALLAQVFLTTPHLAVIDIDTGLTTEMLWSDETAMGLAKVGDTWLCTWSSGFDTNALGELRQLDKQTGKVTGRISLDNVYYATAPVQLPSGSQGFMAMQSTDLRTGSVSIAYFDFDNSKVAWVN